MGTPMGYPATFLLSLDYVLRPLQSYLKAIKGELQTWGVLNAPAMLVSSSLTLAAKGGNKQPVSLIGDRREYS